MIVARFDTEQALQAALDACRAAGIAATTYTPMRRRGAPTHSPIPSIMQIAGLLTALASFALQSYASLRAYPFDVGGRPQFAWPAFIPTAFENGVLGALVAGAAAFAIASRLTTLYHPIDETAMARSASSTGWLLQAAPEAYRLIRSTNPRAIESWGANESRGE